MELAAGQSHIWTLEPPPGHFVHLRVEQRGVDVVLRLLDGNGRPLLTADRPIDDQGVEEIFFVSSAVESPYRLEVDAAGGAPTGRLPGSMTLRVQSLRPAGEQERRLAGALVEFHRGEEARRRGDWSTALDFHSRSLETWRRLGDPKYEAEILDRLARIYAQVDRLADAATHHEMAAERYRQAEDPRGQAISLHYVGLWRGFLGQPEESISAYRRALPLRRWAGDRRGEAITLFALGRAHQLQDETQAALDAYSAALKLLEDETDLQLRAHSVHNLGVLYADLGDWRRARHFLESAVPLWSALDNTENQAGSLNQLGELLLKRIGTAGEDESGDFDRAAVALDAALALRRELGDRRGEASTLANLGRLRRLQGQTAEAGRLYQESLELVRGRGYPSTEAKVLLGLGEVALAEARAEDAIGRFTEAGRQTRALGDLTGEAESWSGLARAHRGRGDLHLALEASSRSLDLLEEVRPRALEPRLRASFFATVQDHYDLHVELLLDLDEREPADGYRAAALLAAERGRARSLLDLLARRPAGAAKEKRPASAEEEELARRIADLDRSRLRLSARAASESARPPELKDVEQRLMSSIDRLEVLRAGSAEGAPSAEIAGLEAIRRAVVESGAVLQVFRLGEERGVRWTMSPGGLEVTRLPPRRQVEALALRTHGLLARSHRRETQPALRSSLCELSRILLGPTPAPSGTPLVVVADGALHYVPFGVLPVLGQGETCPADQPLLARHELVMVPSVSIWIRLSQSLDRDTSPPGSLAVVADPVFSADDPRVVASFESGVPSPAPAPGLRRLDSSRKEAGAVIARAPGPILQLLDFEADKQRILSGALAEFRHLHFATHGVLDVERPALSGIVLSQVDRLGRPRDGVLHTLDLYRLRLDADLVVLSACETALGEEVRGEGLVGLSRAFLSAGARRLVVSLWKVSDGGTAALMESFYRGLFDHGLEPPQALRRAQMEMLVHPDYAAPYFWAGFVVVGEPVPKPKDGSQDLELH